MQKWKIYHGKLQKRRGRNHSGNMHHNFLNRSAPHIRSVSECALEVKGPEAASIWLSSVWAPGMWGWMGPILKEFAGKERHSRLFSYNLTQIIEFFLFSQMFKYLNIYIYIYKWLRNQPDLLCSQSEWYLLYKGLRNIDWWLQRQGTVWIGDDMGVALPEEC